MTRPARTVGRLVVTPRALAEYRDMFVLSDRDLTAGPILDCPGGAAPFGAQVRARGGTVVSADPVYALPVDELLIRIREDLDHVNTWVATQQDSVNWSYVGSPRSLSRSFEVAADLFIMDYTRNGHRYVSAELPHLPLAAGSFRLALCSHLLFCYPEYLSYDEHVSCLVELVRVTSGEVRVYPLADSAGTAYPRMDQVLTELTAQGIRCEIRRANCAWHPGADRLLACWRDSPAQPSTR